MTAKNNDLNRRFAAWGACFALLLACVCAPAAARVRVIPQPASVVERPGEFVFTERTRIVAAASRWKAGDAVLEGTEHEWPVAPYANGRYDVAFIKTGGSGRTLIDWVELRENGNVLQRVTSPGTTDWRLHANDYPLSLPAYHARSRYTIRARISGLGGTNSSGDIYFFRAAVPATSGAPR